MMETGSEAVLPLLLDVSVAADAADLNDSILVTTSIDELSARNSATVTGTLAVP